MWNYEQKVEIVLDPHNELDHIQNPMNCSLFPTKIKDVKGKLYKTWTENEKVDYLHLISSGAKV